ACEYEDGSLHNISVDVDWDSGAMAFKMYGAFQGIADQTTKGLVHLADGAEVSGEWDEARVVGCCLFAALRGDQLVRVDVGSSNATLAQAAKLADAALKRIDHPLKLGGRKSVDPAVAFETGRRAKPLDPCGLITRSEAEALIGALSGPPKP